MPGTASGILSAAQARFGESGRPSAIVLTHGHFDHVGPLETLAAEWDVPVYAHPLEHPYLNGTTSYPPPDPTVGGGLMAWALTVISDEAGGRARTAATAP
jgi:glyoxylase-like metal-dependent hydrolase (beta-lactamase superfamily II)